MKRSDWWMYFVQGEHSKNIKIGIATCPYRRINAIQASCSEKLEILGIARIVSGTSEKHQCHRCTAITTSAYTLVVPERVKPFRSSKTSKERHVAKRLLPAFPRTRSLYHRKLPRTFFPRRDRDEYGGTVHHLRPGVSLTNYSPRIDTYNPSLG